MEGEGKKKMAYANCMGEMGEHEKTSFWEYFFGRVEGKEKRKVRVKGEILNPISIRRDVRGVGEERPRMPMNNF